MGQTGGTHDWIRGGAGLPALACAPLSHLGDKVGELVLLSDPRGFAQLQAVRPRGGEAGQEAVRVPAGALEGGDCRLPGA